MVTVTDFNLHFYGQNAKICKTLSFHFSKQGYSYSFFLCVEISRALNSLKILKQKVTEHESLSVCRKAVFDVLMWKVLRVKHG